MNRMSFATISAGVALALSFGLGGCAGDHIVSVPAKDPGERALTNTHIESTAYHLTSGDRLRVTVFDLAAEINEYTDGDTGAIAVHALEPVPVKGLTTREAAVAISKAFAKANLYRQARVSVDVVSFGPFYVMGEIAKPGEFAYRPGMSLFAAVALAGGHTYRANKRHVYIRRASDTVETEYDVTSDIAILPGDVVRVPELQF